MKTPYMFFFLCCVLTAQGCSIDPRYCAERLYWKAQQQASRVAASGDNALESKQFVKLIAQYQAVIDRYPLQAMAARAHFAIADIYAARKEYQKSQDHLRQIIHNFSSRVDLASQAYFQIGRLYEIQKQWDKAREEYDKIIDLFPLSEIGLRMPRYIMQQLQTAGRVEDFNHAYRLGVRTYENLILQYKNTSVEPAISLALVMAHIGGKNYSQALQVLDSLLDAYPDAFTDGYAFFLKARLYEQYKKDFSGAMDIYRALQNKYASNSAVVAQSLLRMASLYVRVGKPALAQETSQKLFDMYPAGSDARFKAYFAVASVYQQNKYPQKASALYSVMQKEYAGQAIALPIPLLVAALYQQQHDAPAYKNALEQAAQEYERLLSKGDQKPAQQAEIARLLFFCYTHLKDPNRAADFFGGLVQRYPRQPEFLGFLGMVYHAQGKIQREIELYTQARQQFQGNKPLIKALDEKIHALTISAQNKK